MTTTGADVYERVQRRLAERGISGAQAEQVLGRVRQRMIQRGIYPTDTGSTRARTSHDFGEAYAPESAAIPTDVPVDMERMPEPYTPSIGPPGNTPYKRLTVGGGVGREIKPTQPMAPMPPRPSHAAPIVAELQRIDNAIAQSKEQLGSMGASERPLSGPPGSRPFREEQSRSIQNRLITLEARRKQILESPESLAPMQFDVPSAAPVQSQTWAESAGTSLMQGLEEPAEVANVAALLDGGLVTPEVANRFAMGYANRAAQPVSRGTAALNAATQQGAGSIVDLFLKDPGSALQGSIDLTTRSLGATGASLAAAPLAGAGAPLVVGAGSMSAEAINELGNSLSEEGVNPADAAAVLRAMNDPVVGARVRKKVLIKSGVVGSFDALTAKASSMIPGGKTPGRMAASHLAGLGVEMAGGAGGEAASQLASGKEFQGGDVLMEALAEMLPGAATLAGQNVMRPTREAAPSATGRGATQQAAGPVSPAPANATAPDNRYSGLIREATDRLRARAGGATDTQIVEAIQTMSDEERAQLFREVGLVPDQTSKQPDAPSTPQTPRRGGNTLSEILANDREAPEVRYARGEITRDEMVAELEAAFAKNPSERARREFEEMGKRDEERRRGDSNEGGVVAGGVRGPGPVEDAGRGGVAVPVDVRPVGGGVAEVVGNEGSQAGAQPGDVGGGRPDAEVEPWQMTRDEWEANRGDSKNTWGFGEDGTGAVWVSEQMPAPGGWIPETRYTLTPEEAAEYKRREAVKGKAGYAAKVEFRNRMLAKAKGKLTGDHRALVEIALSEGRQVAPEVLADYPELSENAKPQQPVAASSRQDYDDPSRLRNIGIGRTYAGRRVLASMSARGEPTTDPRMIDSASDYRRRGMEVLIRRDGEGFGYVIGVEPQQPGAVTAAPQREGATDEEGHQEGRPERLLTNEPAAPEAAPTGVLSPPPAGAAQAAPSVSPDLDAMSHDELRAYAKSIGVPPRGSPAGIRARIRKAQADQLSAKDNPAKTDSSLPKGQTPEYDALPAATRDQFEAAYAARDVDAMAGYLHAGNTTLRREFAARAGLERVPPGVKRTRAAVESWAQRSQSPSQTSIEPVPAESLAEASPRTSPPSSESERPAAPTAQSRQASSAASSPSPTPAARSDPSPATGSLSQTQPAPAATPDSPSTAAGSVSSPKSTLATLSPEKEARLAELKKRLAAKLNTELRSGFDPELFAIGAEMTALYVEKGARSFSSFARQMVADLGDAVKPYLKAFYNGARDMPGVDASGMDDAATVGATDIEAMLSARRLDYKIRDGLSDRQKVVAAEIEAAVQDQEASDRFYNEQIAGSQGGKVVSTDLARELSPTYHRNKKARLWAVDATGDAARAWSRDRIMRDVLNPPKRPDGERPVLLITGGSPGSGKSRSLQGAIDSADKVWDNQLTNAAEASKVIAAAVQAGWDVQVRYIYRPFEQTIPAIARRALPENEGRPVLVSDAAKSRVAAQRAIKELRLKYAGSDNVTVGARFNVEGGESQPVPVERVEEGGELAYTQDELRPLVESGLREVRESGKYPKEVVDAISGEQGEDGEAGAGRGGGVGTGGPREPTNGGQSISRATNGRTASGGGVHGQAEPVPSSPVAQATPPRVKKYREIADRLIAKAEALEKNSNRRFDDAPGAAITGGSGRRRSGLHKRTERAIEGSLNDLQKAKRLREAAGKWNARADNIDPEVIRQREERKAVVLEAREKVKAKESAERKAAPIINEDGDGVLRITAAEWKKADKDYKGLSIRDGVRVRTLLRGGTLHEVFITDMP
ncbi:MAG: hypothetical protein IT432_11715, partial [Phycisphaerales bacterium]|nr:hypothetical protein [Phycisphaerales bacterium]